MMRWDPVHDARTAFSACMHALCAPGTPVEIGRVPHLTDRAELDTAAAILLGLLDARVSLGVAGGAAAHRLAAEIRFGTGATDADVADSDWVLVHGPAAEAIRRARRGTRVTPETGATVVVATNAAPQRITVSGPGIPGGNATVWVPLDAVSVHAFIAANAARPRGVDLLLTTKSCVIGLPRSLEIGVG
ncbi:phosphonate C-P lyase system protein PhnH [Mycolicibacterium hassiacum DSM 44199]|jgi:alpha-D-ribose 1-methylphosphonate 5-triphosphate synthase subunit PhnH|uniref:Phosphonate C-P lyase system protein PhnH n=2 Tax=Mycolicibacterium hassiacum TaxID=46351 RepID=K5B8E1_MYCHD|nr:phosphonate C-P lyase system protein PhnH [Mycolicibacterium hassiacum]EKF23538.1 phosphonate C-P lyase system protein PhnH [Mycolicibacterium hassiacum DSM 44199]MDA4084799.1 phosphonate C-P lyase system protein PhnH [Mycolicibacterium hassiacum DSM 44199]